MKKIIFQDFINTTKKVVFKQYKFKININSNFNKTI